MGAWLKKYWALLVVPVLFLFFRQKSGPSYEDVKEANDDAKQAQLDLIDVESNLAKEKIKHDHDKEVTAIEKEAATEHAALDDYTVDNMHAEAIALDRGSTTGD